MKKSIKYTLTAVVLVVLGFIIGQATSANSGNFVGQFEYLGGEYGSLEYELTLPIEYEIELGEETFDYENRTATRTLILHDNE